jgi:23S rRNA pseudouridine2605 synthase
VKVAGQPDEGKLDKLRAGVSIAEKGGRRVRTAPAKIRPIRDADNPWFEVTIIEGRNRQVRKMFEEVGHHVEKIRRVQYGPLALDVPPGEFRSLTLEEISRLKAAAAGKKMFQEPRPEVMPTVRLQGPKPVSEPAIRTADVSRQPIAKVPFRPRAEAPRYSNGKGKAPFRPKTDDRRHPKAKTQYGAKPKAAFQSRSAGPYEAKDKPKYESAGRPPRRPRDENRPRGNSPRFERGPGAASSFRGASRPPFKQRKPFVTGEEGAASGRSSAGRSFETPRAGTRLGGPKARRPFDRSKPPSRDGAGAGFDGPKARRPFDKSKANSRGGRKNFGGRPSRPRGPRR